MNRGETRIAGREIGAIALGTAKLAFSDTSRADGVKLIEAAVDAGAVLVDTALAYTRPGMESYAEELLRDAVARVGRERVVIATKGGHWRGPNGFPIDGRRGTLRRHCERSLKHLGVARIDLYQLHHPDPETPIEESAAALDELRRKGLVGAIGLSNVDADQLARAQTVARIDAVQNRLSLSRPDDLPMALACAAQGIAYLAHQPLNGAGDVVAPRVAQTAARHGVSPYRLMLAWLLARSTGIIPVVGATRVDTIIDSLAAVKLHLDDTDLAALSDEP